MRFHEYRVVLVAVSGIMALIVASPALSRLLVLPRTEFFTEMWILGSNHRAESYPFNITRGHDYNVFLGVGNHLGHFAYYLVEVKFRNHTQSAPSSFNRTSSSLSSLFNITAFVADAGTWELPLTFSFDYTYDEALSRVKSLNLTLNNSVLNLRDYVILFDSSRNAFLGNLFFELWLLNPDSGSFQYHNRFVGLLLNMTISNLA